MKIQSSFTLPPQLSLTANSLDDAADSSPNKRKVKKTLQIRKKVKKASSSDANSGENPLTAQPSVEKITSGASSIFSNKTNKSSVVNSSNYTVAAAAPPPAAKREEKDDDDEMEDDEEYELIEVEEVEEEDEEEDKDENVPLAALSVHASLERLVDRITEIKSAPWTNFNASKPDHDRFEQVAHDLGMCVPRSYDEHFSLLPRSFLPSEFEPRSVLHSMLALIGGFSWSPLRRRHRVSRGGPGQQHRSHRVSGPENLSRLFDHFTAAALRVHVLRHRAINSGMSMKVIAESAVLMGAISEQINAEVEALSHHLTKEQMAELPVDRVAFRDTMDSFLFEKKVPPPPPPPPAAAAAAAASSSFSVNASQRAAAASSSSAAPARGPSRVAFSMSAFLGEEETTSDKPQMTINQEALMSAIQSAASPHKNQHPQSPKSPSSAHFGGGDNNSPLASGSASPASMSMTFGGSVSHGNFTNTISESSQQNNFLKGALVTVVDPDVPFELMTPEARAVAYDAVFDSIDVRHAGEINWRTFFAALTQASLLPKLGGLVHHPRILDFSHWIMPVKMREVLSDVHHVVTYSKGNSQIVVGHDAAVVMNLPRANAFMTSAPGTAGGDSKNGGPGGGGRLGGAGGASNRDVMDSAAHQQMVEQEKIDAYFASLRFLTTFQKVKCFVNGQSTAMRIKQEQPIRLGELLARARSVGTVRREMTGEEQQKHQRHLVHVAKQMKKTGFNNAQHRSSNRAEEDELRRMIEEDERREEEERREAEEWGDPVDEDMNMSRGISSGAAGGGGGGVGRRKSGHHSSGVGGGGGGGGGGNKKKEDLVHGDRLTALSNPKQHRLPDPQIVQVLVVESVNVILVSSTDGTVKCYHIGGSSTLPNCELFFTVSINNTVSAITPSWDGDVLYFGTRHGHIVAMDFPIPQRNLTTSRLRVECMPLRRRSGHRVVATDPLAKTLRPPAKACKVPDSPFISYLKEKSEEELAKEALRAVQFYDVNLRAQALPHAGIVSCIIHLEVEKCILSCSYDHTIMLSQEHDLQPLVQYCGHTSGVHKAVHSDDYNFFVSVAFDSRPLVWSVSTQPSKKPPMELHDPVKPHAGTVVDCDYIPSSNIVVTIDDLGVVKFWDMRLIHCFETASVAKFQPTSMSGFSAESGSNSTNAKIGDEDQIDLQNLMSLPVRFVGMSLLYEPSSINSPTETLRIFCYTKHHGACVCEWNLRLKERVVRNAAEDQPIVATFLISVGAVNDVDQQQHQYGDGGLSAHHYFNEPSHFSLSGSSEPLHHHKSAADAAPTYDSVDLSSQILANVTPANYRTWDIPSGVMRDYFTHDGHAAAGGICIGTMNEMRTIFVLGTRDGSVFAHNAQSGTAVQSFRRLHRQPVQHLACFSYAPQFNLKRNAPRIMIMSLAQRHLHLVVLDTGSDGGVVENAGYIATKQLAAAQAGFTTAMATTALEKGVWLELLNDEEEDEAELLSLQYATQMGMRHRVRCFDVNDKVDLVAVGTSHAKVMGFALSAVCASAALRIPIGSVYLPPPRKLTAEQQQQEEEHGGKKQPMNHDAIQSKIATGDLDAIVLKLFPRIGMGLVVTESSRLCLFSLGCNPLGAAESFSATAAGAAAMNSSVNGGAASAAAAASGAATPSTGGCVLSFLSDDVSPWSLTHVAASRGHDSEGAKKKLPNHFQPRAAWQHACELPKKHQQQQRHQHHQSRRGKRTRQNVQLPPPLPTVVVSPERLPHLLYVGDDRGFVTLYDLTPILAGVAELPRMVNRWIAHNGAVVSIFFFAARDKIDAMVGTSGTDQTVHAFSLSGALYFGALDLHQRLSILSVPSFVSDDLGRFDEERHDALLQGATSHVFMSKEMCFEMAREIVDQNEHEIMRIMARHSTPSAGGGSDLGAGGADDQKDEQEFHLDEEAAATAGNDSLVGPGAGAAAASSFAVEPEDTATLSPIASLHGIEPPAKSGAPTSSRQEQMRLMKQKQEEAKRQKQENARKERRARVHIATESFKQRTFQLVAEALRRVLLVPRAKANLPLEHVPWSRAAFASDDALHIMESLRMSHFEEAAEEGGNNTHLDDSAQAIIEAGQKQQQLLRDEMKGGGGGVKGRQHLSDDDGYDDDEGYHHHKQQRQQHDDEEARKGGGDKISMSAPAPQPKYTFDMTDSDDEDEDGSKPIETPSFGDALKHLQGGLTDRASLTHDQYSPQHPQQQQHATLGAILNRQGPMTPTPARASRPPSAVGASPGQLLGRDGTRCLSATRRPPSAATVAGKHSVLARWDKKQKWDTMVPGPLKFDAFVEQERQKQLQKQAQQQEQQQQQFAKSASMLNRSSVSFLGSSTQGGAAAPSAPPNVATELHQYQRSAPLSKSITSVSFADSLAIVSSADLGRSRSDGDIAHTSASSGNLQVSLSKPPVRAAAKQILQRAETTRNVLRSLQSSPVMQSDEEHQASLQRSLSTVVSKHTVAPGLEQKDPLEALLSDPRSSGIKPESRTLLTKFSDLRQATKNSNNKPLEVSGLRPASAIHSSTSMVQNARVRRGPVAMSIRSLPVQQQQPPPLPQNSSPSKK